MRQGDSDERRSDFYDVISIVGGGPGRPGQGAGADALSQRGLKVALLDRRPFTVPDDKRAFALSAGVKRVLDTLGVWASIGADAEPIRAMKITDSGTGDISRPVFLTFEGDVAPGEPYAHMVANRVLTRVLLEALAGRGGWFLAPVDITGFTRGEPASGPAVAAGRPDAARAADHRRRWRAMSGCGTWRVSASSRPTITGSRGMVTTIAHELPHHGTAFEHFRPAGPFASLPLPGNRSSLVWTETTQEAARLKALPLEQRRRP